MALDFPTERFARNGDGSQKPVAVLGGGPAGLTAGYLLAQKGRPVIVLEAEDQVGGIAKTEVRDGYRFDLGGHRFFTKSKEVDDLWHEVMKEEFLKRPRMSRSGSSSSTSRMSRAVGGATRLSLAVGPEPLCSAIKGC